MLSLCSGRGCMLRAYRRTPMAEVWLLAGDAAVSQTSIVRALRAVEAKVKAEVADLCAKFPIYPNL